MGVWVELSKKDSRKFDILACRCIFNKAYFDNEPEAIALRDELGRILFHSKYKITFNRLCNPTLVSRSDDFRTMKFKLVPFLSQYSPYWHELCYTKDGRRVLYSAIKSGLDPKVLTKRFLVDECGLTIHSQPFIYGKLQRSQIKYREWVKLERLEQKADDEIRQICLKNNIDPSRFGL
jgi:hypothetical protein